MPEDEEWLLLSGGKTSCVGGSFKILLLSLRAEWDSTFEAKEDAIKIEVTIAKWVFFFYWWVEEGSQDIGNESYEQ